MCVLKIDHVTIAGKELNPLRMAFANLGLETVYGGPHSNGVTHMAMHGFQDGSYIELISLMEIGQTSPWWHDHITQDGGPCAWAIQVEDIDAEAERLAGLGIIVKGPRYYSRRRPDNRLVEWDLAFLGAGEPGVLLPFLITDRTPRAFRVQPAASALANALDGVAQVLLGVADLRGAIALFRQAFGWQTPDKLGSDSLAARLAHFAGQPVTLLQPLGKDSWLAARLAIFGDCPCAFLIQSQDLEKACQRLGIARIEPWFQGRVAWFDPSALQGCQLGVIGD